MRYIRDHLFPISAVLLAVLVLAGTIYILFGLTRQEEILTGPPDLYITVDNDPFFLQEASSKWHADLGMTRIVGGEGHGHEATEKDEIETSAETILFDFGKYPPASISATYAESLTGAEMPAHFEEDRLYLEDGLWVYTVTAEWEAEDYNGTASYSLRVRRAGPGISVSPPALKLTVDSSTHTFPSSRYRMQHGTQITFADGDHPLRMEYDPPLTVTGEQAALQLDPMPDDYEVFCWPVGTAIDAEGNTAADPVILLPHHGRIDLQEGCWIYQLKAEWNETSENCGEAFYSFRIDCEKQ